VRFDDDLVFLWRPSLLLDVRIQVIVPSADQTEFLQNKFGTPFSALLAQSTSELRSDDGPLLESMLSDQSDDLIILLTTSK